MPLLLVKKDITAIACDALVNATNTHLSPGGHGVDAAIHGAAGPELLNECRRIGSVDVGKAVLTGAYNLPCKGIIHTAGPVWRGGTEGETELLRSSYYSALKLASEQGFASVAFPLISSGAFGFPKELVLKLAADCISDYLSALSAEDEMTVYLAVPDTSVYSAGIRTEEGLDNYLFRRRSRVRYENPRLFEASACVPQEKRGNGRINRVPLSEKIKPAGASQKLRKARAKAAAPDRIEAEEDIALSADCVAAPEKAESKSLEELIKNLDESFPKKLLRLIDLKGMSDVACYKAANVSRQTWHKIISDSRYMPSKNTVISFSVALKLTLEETQALLASTGFILSESILSDRIISYFLVNGIYDIYTIDSELLKYDQPTLWNY